MIDRLDTMFQHAADLGIEVEYADLGPTRHGEYHARAERIVLHYLLTRSQMISTLAHELGHQRFGDTCSTPANERRAWEYGAALIVTPGEYRQAERHAGPHVGAIAAELEVTPRLVEAWRRWWCQRGQHLPPETLTRLARVPR